MTVAAFGVVKRPNPQGTSILNDKSMRQLPFLSSTCAKTQGTRAAENRLRQKHARPEENRIVGSLFKNNSSVFVTRVQLYDFVGAGPIFGNVELPFCEFSQFGGL